jgi:hypothetical protein
LRLLGDRGRHRLEHPERALQRGRGGAVGRDVAQSLGERLHVAPPLA